MCLKCRLHSDVHLGGNFVSSNEYSSDLFRNARNLVYRHCFKQGFSNRIIQPTVSPCEDYEDHEVTASLCNTDDDEDIRVEYMPITNEDSWLECSNVVADICWVPEDHTNGCSNPMPWLDADNPAGCTGEGNDTSFLDACNDHDICYGTCNSFFSICNGDFGDDMDAVCEALDDHESECYDDCVWWADKYEWAVDTYGASYYNSAQVDACVCNDCEL